MTGKNDGTGAGLLAFLDWAGRTGQMTPGTANAWAAATRQVLGIEDDPDAVDVLTLDAEAFFERFETLNRMNYSPSSMATYRSRFRSAVVAYTAWLNNEPWKPSKRPARTKTTATKPVAETPSATSPGVESSAVPQPVAETTHRLVNYSVPLRPDLMVSINLPMDLSTADAERIATFVRSLAFDTSSSTSSTSKVTDEARG